jgi:hypothetical protein
VRTSQHQFELGVRNVWSHYAMTHLLQETRNKDKKGRGNGERKNNKF